MGKLAKFIFFYTDDDEGVKPIPIEWDTATGASPLSLVNSLAHAIRSLVQYGKCVQDGTPTPSAPVDILCNNGALKYSANMANVNEQTASVGYYINASGAVLADVYNWFYQAYIPVKPNTSYTLSMPSPVYYVTISEYSTADDSGFIIRKAGKTGGNSSLTITTEENTNYIRFGSNLNRVAVTLEMVLAINWMLNEGDAAKPYAPYAEGGIYCGGTHPGQNLVDLSAVTDDYYYDSRGVYTALSNARLTDYIPVKSGQKYTVYVKAVKAGVAANVRCNLFDYAKVWKSQSTFAVNSGSEGVGVISPTEDGYLRVSANYTGTGAQADWSVLQIVRGEYTLATMPSYEPYTEVPYQPEVLMVGGANLFDASSYTEINAYVNANTGVLTAGSPGSMTQYCAVIPCKPNAQYDITGQGTSAWGAFTSDSIGTTATAFVKGGILTTGANDRYLIGLVRANGDSIDYRNTLAVQEMQTITDIPMLLSVGDDKDELELISGHADRAITVFRVSPDLNWALASGSGYKQFYASDTQGQLKNSVSCMSNIAPYGCTASNRASYQFGCYTGGTGNLCFQMIGEASLNTVDAWKDFLRTNGVYVVAVKATETTEQTTAHSLHSYEGTTIVEAQTNVDPVTLSVEYATSA